MKKCPQCIDNEMSAEGKYLKEDASNYDKKAYDNNVTVDIIIATIVDNDLKVLLIQRKYPPFKDCWAMPGGFLKDNVGLEQTAMEELEEETGLKKIYLEQLGTYGDPGRDPRKRIVTVAYFALVPWKKLEKQNIEGADDAKDAKWFSLKKVLAKDKLAFDHSMILKDFINRLKGKIWYTPIVFELIPRDFTLPEIQKAYEIITGQIDTVYNFRRKLNVLFKLKKLDKFREGMRRPAQLYRLEK